MKPDNLDKIIHERARLAIMSALAARGSLTFNELKELLKMSDGNISVHAGILEKHSLITITKEFAGKKPRTTFSITKEGSRQFQKYIKNLEQMIKGDV